jgi:hypothetical protein
LLAAADRHLARPQTITIIGGSAAALSGADSTTTDIDTFEPMTEELEQALALARAETGLEIPCAQSTVADIPYNAEDRVERPLSDLAHLEVKVLERHDLALSKALRYIHTDLEQLRAVHGASPFAFDVLVERYVNEMDHVIGDRRVQDEQFLSLIEELFGEMKRLAAQRALSRTG